jgi:hypothetical protein
MKSGTEEESIHSQVNKISKQVKAFWQQGKTVDDKQEIMDELLAVQAIEAAPGQFFFLKHAFVFMVLTQVNDDATSTKLNELGC